MSRPKPDQSFCRRRSVPLFPENARISRGRFVGACRPCESAVSREKYLAMHPGARAYTDARRKYPLETASPSRPGTQEDGTAHGAVPSSTYAHGGTK